MTTGDFENQIELGKLYGRHIVHVFNRRDVLRCESARLSKCEPHLFESDISLQNGFMKFDDTGNYNLARASRIDLISSYC